MLINLIIRSIQEPDHTRSDHRVDREIRWRLHDMDGTEADRHFGKSRNDHGGINYEKERFGGKTEILFRNPNQPQLVGCSFGGLGTAVGGSA